MAQVGAYTREDGAVRFRDPEGNLTWIAPDKTQNAVGLGYAPVTPDEHFAAERQAELENSPVAATAAAIGRGATLGLSDIALTESGLVSHETLQGLKEAHPVKSAIAEVGGAIAPAVLTGGATALESGSLAAGKAVTEALGGRLLGKVAGKVVESGVRGAAMGGVFGAGQGVSEGALAGEWLDPATIAKRALEGAAIGTAFDVGFMGVGAALGGAGKLAGKALSWGKVEAKEAVAARRLSQLELLDDVQRSQAGLVDIAREAQDWGMARKNLLARQASGFLSPEETAQLASIEGRISALKTSAKELQAQIEGKVETVRAGTVTTTERQSIVENIARRLEGTSAIPEIAPLASTVEARAKRIAAVIEEGGGLTPEMRLGIARDSLEAELARENVLNVAIGATRSEQRGLLGSLAAGPADDLSNGYRAALDEAREVSRRRVTLLRREIRDSRAAQGEFDGIHMQAQGIAPSMTVSERASAGKVTTTTTTRTTTPIIERTPVTMNAQRLAETRFELPKQLLEDLSQKQTRGVLEEFVAWRSAGAIAGMALGGWPGAFIGGAIGLKPVQEAIRSQLAKSGVMFGGLLKYVAPSKRILTAGIVDLSIDEAAKAQAQALDQTNDPSAITADFGAGYLRSGMEPTAAQRLSEMRGAQALALRNAAQRLDPLSPASRASFARTMRAVQAPQAIGARIKDGTVSDEDLSVLKTIDPETYGIVQSAAKKVLQSNGKELDSKGRDLLQRVVGETVAVARRNAAARQIAFKTSGSGQPTKMTGPNAGAMQTSGQSAAATLGG